MAACNPAIDAVFMLNANQIVPVEIEELRGPFIRGNILLLLLQTHLLWIFIAGLRIVDGDREQPAAAEFGCERGAQVRRKRGDAALARHIVADKRNARWQGQAATC